MASLDLKIDGIEEIQKAVIDAGSNADLIFKWALYAGMEEIIEELNKTIPKSLNPSGVSSRKHYRIDDGWETSATIGEGKTKTGENTFKVLNILEFGEHNPKRHKTPIAPRHYIKRALQKAKAKGEQKMSNAFDEKIKEITGNVIN